MHQVSAYTCTFVRCGMTCTFPQSTWMLAGQGGRCCQNSLVNIATLPDAHTEVLHLVEYIDKDVATWLGRTSRVPELLHTRP